MKTALTISGSDSCGGAGLQCDLKTFSILGVYGMSAVTTLTAQNTLGVKASVDLEPIFIRQQIETVAGDIQVDATRRGAYAYLRKPVDVSKLKAVLASALAA